MAKCQRFSFTDGLTDVAPGALQTVSIVGDVLSVGVVRFSAPGALQLPVKEHAHGEEASLQINGGCRISQGIAAENAPLHEVTTREGTVMFVPADHPHYGVNSYDATGLSVRLNVVTPPRADFGAKGSARATYHALEKDAR
jgi:uncharacterized RmlC-like cupin family protein